MVFFDLSTCLPDATLHDNSPTLQYKHLCNAADTWLWHPFIVSVLRRVNFPFMINTPLKEGQGKNTPIRRLDIPYLCLLLLRWTEAGEGGSTVTNPSVMWTLTSDVPWSLTVLQTPAMQTLNSAALMAVLRFNSQCWSNFNESDLQSPLQPFSSGHAMLLPNKMRSVAWWEKNGCEGD